MFTRIITQVERAAALAFLETKKKPQAARLLAHRFRRHRTRLEEDYALLQKFIRNYDRKRGERK